MKYLIFILMSLTSQEVLKKQETKSYYINAPKLFDKEVQEGSPYVRCPTPWEEIKKSD
jgi:hypothetical protein